MHERTNEWQAWAKSVISATWKRVIRHRQWLAVYRAMQSLYRPATTEEVAKHGGDICVICHDELRPPPGKNNRHGDNNDDGGDREGEDGGDMTVILRCNHLFHRSCFKTFLTSAYEGHLERKCPICRRDLLGADKPPEVAAAGAAGAD